MNRRFEIMCDATDYWVGATLGPRKINFFPRNMQWQVFP